MRSLYTLLVEESKEESQLERDPCTDGNVILKVILDK
jgi:hypothetical protein